jgi:hypothetical protein
MMAIGETRKLCTNMFDPDPDSDFDHGNTFESIKALS